MTTPNQSRAGRWIPGFLALIAVFAIATVLLASGPAVHAQQGRTAQQAESGHPERTETEHPERTETEHPEATETHHAEATQTERPEATETEHAEATRTEHAEATETEHPEATETHHPEATRTEHPEATETHHPEGTRTAHPEPSETRRPEGTRTPAAGSPRLPGDDHGRDFAQTGQRVTGLFLNYWDQRGGLRQQGLPISPLMREVSPLNGKTYTVQYFERAVFEYHPENAGTPFEVLLSQLGTLRYHQMYPSAAPAQTVNRDNPLTFRETSHQIGGRFRAYWESLGGLAQQGFPITDEFTEMSPLNGKSYTVQYFERAVFEYHPENAGTPFEVLLSQLGRFQYDQKHGR
jgi:hypothetical protein